MLDFFRYDIFDTFWSLQYAVEGSDGFHRSITLLRIGWFECIAAVMLFAPSIAAAYGDISR